MGNQLTLEDCQNIRTDEQRLLYLTPIRVIGSGGHANAVLCHDSLMNQEVVIKIMNDNDMYRDEVIMHCLLSHIPYIIKLHDYFKTKISDNWYQFTKFAKYEFMDPDDKFIVFIMEKAHGTFLELRILDNHLTFISENDAIQIIVQLLSAIYMMSHIGFCHQDLQFNNIMYVLDSTQESYSFQNITIHITSPYKIKIIDFNQSSFEPNCEDVIMIARAMRYLIPCMSHDTASVFKKFSKILEYERDPLYIMSRIQTILKHKLFTGIVEN